MATETKESMKEDGKLMPVEFVGDSFEKALMPFQTGGHEPESVRDGIQRVAEAGGKLDILAGCLLTEVRDNGYWRDWERVVSGKKRKFLSFDDYLENEVPFKRRKAFYLMSIYEKFVVELKIPMTSLREIEWSKAKEVLPIINADNWEGLFKAIKSMSVRQVMDMVSVERAKSRMKILSSGTSKETDAPDEPESDESMVKITFHLAKAQAENIHNALEIAKFETGSEKPGHLLDIIATDFIAGRVSSDDRLESLCGRLDLHVQNIERAFGVKLEVVAATTMKT